MLVREFGEEEKKGKSFPRLYLVISFYSRGLIFFKLLSYSSYIRDNICLYVKQLYSYSISSNNPKFD